MSKRYACSAVGIDQRIIVFGGTQGGTPLAELWVLEVDASGSKVAWKQPRVAGTMPPARAWHTSTLVAPPGASHRATMVVFGGCADGFSPFSDAHILSLYPPEEEEATDGPRLIFRDQIDTAVDAATEKVTITHLARPVDALGKPLDLRWAVSVVEEACDEEGPEAWPAGRSAHAAACLWDGRLLIHGGVDSHHVPMGDVWLLDVAASLAGTASTTSPWSKPEVSGTAPPAASGHCAATFGPRLLLTGGELPPRPYILDAASMVWSTLAGPSIDSQLCRSHPASLPSGKRLLLHGGTDPNSDEALGDETLELCTEAAAASTTLGGFDGHGALAVAPVAGRRPPNRSLHSAARAGTVVVLLGGKGGRHGLSLAEEDAAETTRRTKEERELADEIDGIVKKVQAGVKKMQKAEKAALALAAAAEAEAAAAEAKDARDVELRKRGDEALRKEKEELRRRKAAEEERKKEASLRTGGGYKLGPAPAP